ncbi:putative signal transduction protein with EAL and GGDEF domain [Actinoplanes octamycinicus]|uniref:Putative signal transduction protein with EAL and GGDEF domain n=1 Tax=Actinoplanes octamycinicus TaxID=135948 RepID=A0A7W7H4E9_9ACTN|nr:hypothetical protein [Actinoplanes octamycinicus]MBB4743467.1 putative signal transduction protein with EAL and GGDEF domain [Actinoplanes octamycinicus]GIE62548.1 hypothetical protein Aoc01nite_79500 [Actinoplanes octamycinicus]
MTRAAEVLETVLSRERPTSRCSARSPSRPAPPDLRTVIEGSGTAAPRDAMRRLGCDLGQGYRLCRPVHPEDLLRTIDPPLPPEPGPRRAHG